MSHCLSVYPLNFTVCVSDADAKVMEIVFEGGAHFALRNVPR